MDLALVSDSHVPSRADSIPEQFRELIADADETIHAGDFETRDTLEQFRSLTDELTAVYGNADGPELGLPAVAETTVGEYTFVVTHGMTNHPQAAVRDATGGSVMSGEDWAQAVADTARVRTRSWDGESVVGVGGHTHVVEDNVYDGVRVLNPGSVTGAAPADTASMFTVTVEDELDVTLHEL